MNPYTSFVNDVKKISYNPLEDAAKKICDNVQVISGAAKVGNALVAIAEGYTAALNL